MGALSSQLSTSMSEERWLQDQWRRPHLPRIAGEREGRGPGFSSSRHEEGRVTRSIPGRHRPPSVPWSVKF